MTHLTGNERARYVRQMFGRIAHRYDLLNRIMTLGQDIRWRRHAIAHLKMPPDASVIDLGSGTGDIAFEIARQKPAGRIIASDFTAEMVQVGKKRRFGEHVAWVIADAQALPFPAEAFDGVISGFLLRNVPDVDRTLQEQRRILKPGGRVVSLDTTPPRPNILKPFLNFHLNRIIPVLGRLIAGDAEAYTYLPNSTAKFLTAETLADRFGQAGFQSIGFTRRMLGTVAIHWAEKPIS
jgi:demethylmenaquinone methyltransferase/2-methoxy-6-polyprenyl-1,4-benzoquinol methylase